MADEEIRVGLIGAGGNVRNRHIPGFRKVKGVEIVGVVNRSPRVESTCGRPIRHSPGVQHLAGIVG